VILLDTNICIYVAKGRPAGVLEHFNAHEPGELAISVITAMELRVGTMKAGAASKPARIVEALLARLRVLALDISAVDRYAALRLDLERRGLLIGPMDLQIAAHALALDATLVTNNEREFARVPGLKLANWASSG
jgi:tRNA(fMet)-specific endonuclease VapC